VGGNVLLPFLLVSSMQIIGSLMMVFQDDDIKKNY
jgi:hypothetical protein